jgi:hypothetical protein
METAIQIYLLLCILTGIGYCALMRPKPDMHALALCVIASPITVTVFLLWLVFVGLKKGDR